MKVHPYLNFDGNAEEAFQLYKSVFGGEFTANIKLNTAPGAEKLSQEEQNRTLHIALPIAEGVILMASDIVPSAGHILQTGSQTYIMLSPESRVEADRLFNGLSKEGSIEMKMENTFWGDYFGSFKDKYGILWMISYNEQQV